MSAHHTPGQWSKHKYSNSEPFVVMPADGSKSWVAYIVSIGSGDVRICDVLMQCGAEGGYPTVQNKDECDANARLISASPDLLEALEKMMDKYGSKNPELDCEVTFKARSAIAKAKGKA